MKILHLLGQQDLPRDPNKESTSGIVRVVLEVAKRQVSAGHQVTVVVANKTGWNSTWEGVRLVGLKRILWAQFNLGRKPYDFSVHLPYIFHTSTKDYDVIHSHGYSYLRFLHAKVKIVHYHGDPFYQGSRNEGIDMKPADFRTLSLYSDAQIAVSQFVGKELARGLNSRGNIHVIYNGVDCTSFSSGRWLTERDMFRKRWNIPENGAVILFSGAIAKEKGVIYLAHAFLHLASVLPNLYLIIAGSSKLWGNELSEGKWQISYEEEVISYLKAYIDTGRVVFVGKTPYKEMPLIYASCDLVVVPSIWKEAFNLAALEAQAAGRPVVASSTGGLVEIVDSQTGILVEPRDEADLETAILRLVTNPELREHLGRNARLKAEGFTWDRTVKQIEQIYREVLAYH